MHNKNLRYIFRINIVAIAISFLFLLFLFLSVPSIYTGYANKQKYHAVIERETSIEEIKENYKGTIDAIYISEQITKYMFKVVFFYGLLVTSFLFINILLVKRQIKV